MGQLLSILAWTVLPYIGTKGLDALFGDVISPEEMEKIKFEAEQRKAAGKAESMYLEEEAQKQVGMEQLLLKQAERTGRQKLQDREMDFQRELGAVRGAQDSATMAGALSSTLPMSSFTGGQSRPTTEAEFRQGLKKPIDMGLITGIR